MDLAPEQAAMIELVETHLASLDPILLSFCEQHDYTFRRLTGVYPRRRAWQREEVDLCLDLTPDLTVIEITEHRFSPDMPWSLHITASTLPPEFATIRILTEAVFSGLPFSSLHSRLAGDLAAGLAKLQTFTPEVINERGRT